MAEKPRYEDIREILRKAEEAAKKGLPELTISPSELMRTMQSERFSIAPMLERMPLKETRLTPVTEEELEAWRKQQMVVTALFGGLMLAPFVASAIGPLFASAGEVTATTAAGAAAGAASAEAAAEALPWWATGISRAVTAMSIGKLTVDYFVKKVIVRSAMLYIGNRVREAYAKASLDKIKEKIEEVPVEEEAYQWKRANKFIEYVSDLNWYLWAIPYAISWIDSDSARILANAMRSWYWALGLGWLTWSATGPFVRHYITDPLDEYLSETLRDRLPSVSDITRALKQDLIDRNTAEALLAKHGYSDEWIDVILKLKAAEEVEKLRELTKSEILNLFEAGKLKRPEALERLLRLGYSDADANLLLDLAEEKKVEKHRELSYSLIKKAFVERKITDSEAENYLRNLGYTDKDIKLILELWDIERRGKPRLPTLGQLEKARKAGVITKEEFRTWLKRLGYSEEAANLIVDLVEKEIEEAQKKAGIKPKPPRASDIIAAWRYGVLSRQEAKEKLVAIGYSEEAAELMLTRWEHKPQEGGKTASKSDIRKAYMMDLLDENAAIGALLELGYDPDWAIFLVTLWANEKYQGEESGGGTAT